MDVIKYLVLCKSSVASTESVLRGPLFSACVLLTACGGGGGGTGSNGDAIIGGAAQDKPGEASAIFAIRDGGNQPIGGAVVILDGGGSKPTATTDAEGFAEFRGLRSGEITYTVTADGFGSLEGSQILLDEDPEPTRVDIYLLAHDAWATPRLVVLGTRMTELAGDGSEMTFAADVAVINADSEALETLTSAQLNVAIP